ncbi:hypothetical protein TNCV_999951 [Trichonephila clavipes]|nr:hypothetical protein TNCV_999951 [Trichonephila clavipes]
MTIENKVLLYTAVLRPILSSGCPVWGYAAKSNFPFCNSLNNFRAANLEPVHSSPSSNHKAAFQPFQDGLFHHFDFVSKCIIATPSLHIPTTNQFLLHQELLLHEAPLTTMIWDGGSLCEPYAQRQSSSFEKAMSGSAFGKLKLRLKSPLKIRGSE